MFYEVTVLDATNRELVDKILGDCTADSMKEKILAIILCKTIEHGDYIGFQIRVKYADNVIAGKWEKMKLSELITIYG